VQASLIPPLLEFSWVFCDYFQEAVRITLEICAWMVLNLPGALPSLLLNMFKMFQMPISKIQMHSFVS
jgi:hypothetical protein